MSPAAADTDSAIPHPRETAALFGHSEAEAVLLNAYRSGRTPHAWLIGGEPGVGKATLAYRFARFVLAHPDPAAAAVQQARSLAVPAEHPVARRIAGRAHGDLLELHRVLNEKTGKLYTETRVDDVRRTVSFFGSTASEGGWRIAIVDPIEDLNRAGLNALLKVVEEPPERALVLLVTDAPGRVLATIRSRCRLLKLRPLSPGDTAEALAAALRESPAAVAEAAAAAGGLPGKAVALIEGDMLELGRRVAAMLALLPQTDPRGLHALGEAIAGAQAEPLAAFMDGVNDWLSARLKGGERGLPELARIAEAYASVNRAAREAEAYNLDRKPFVFGVFRTLSEAVRP